VIGAATARHRCDLQLPSLREQHRLGSTATQPLRDRCGEQTTNALQEQHR